MDTLRRQSVVRENEVFTALFPRGYTPQQLQQYEATRPAEGLPTLKDDVRTFRIPKLGVLSPKTPRALMTTLPMTASDCAVVWKFLCDWVTAQIAMEAPATIPGFGTVTMRTQALKIRVPFFEPDRAFLDKHGLRVDTAASSLVTLPRAGSSSSLKSPRVVGMNTNDSPRGSSTIDVLSFNFMEMAACCGKHVEVPKAKDWLQTVLQKMGEAMRQCERVEFDMGIGVVACTNRVIETPMLPRHTSTSSKISSEVRAGESAVKRTLTIPSCPQTARTKAFLSGSTFSSAIRLHPAVNTEDKVVSVMFSLDAPHHGLKRAPRRLTAVVPGSPGAFLGASPRTQRLKNQLESDGNGQLQDLTTTSVSGYPALFDTISRTYCVEHDLNLSFLQPSNRIASNYAPIAASLIMAKHTQRSGTNRNIDARLTFLEETLPTDPPYPGEPTMHNASKVSCDDIPGDPKQRAISEERYFAYLDHRNRLMDVRWLAPLPQDLVDRIVASAIKYLNETPSGHMRIVLDAARDEFVSNYHASVKKAVMDYLLMRIATRERLGILCGTPPYSSLPLRWQWGDNKGANGCMDDLRTLVAVDQNRRQRYRPSTTVATNTSSQRTVATGDSNLSVKKLRRKRLKLKLLWTLMMADPQIRALQYIWFDFEDDLLLVKLPDSRQLSENMKPMDLHAFQCAQLSHAAQVKEYVMEHWYERARQLVKQVITRATTDAPASTTVARINHLFNALAVQMSLQIRSLIIKSVRAYTAYFELFGHHTSDVENGTFGDSVPNYSALMMSLTVRDGEVKFSTPLNDVPDVLISVLHNMTHLFHNISRIESQFDTSLEFIGAETRGSSMLLWNVNSQETEILTAAARIREIIDLNLIELRELQAAYTEYSVGYQRISNSPEVDDSKDSDGLFSSSKFESWRTEVQNVRDVALSLASSARAFRHMKLFSVDCYKVNIELLATFSSWIHRQLYDFAEGTAAYNTRLRQQYKDVAARLAKRPLDLYELVEAEAFVRMLKSSKLQELQSRVEDVKQRMEFLLFHRESVHIDGPEDTSSVNPVFTVPSELLGSTAKTIRWRTHIERLLEDAEGSLVGERARIEAIFLAKRNRFHAEIEEFDMEVKSFSKKGDLRHAATYVVQLAKMKEVLVGFRRQMESIREEEVKLNWKPTDFSKLDDIAEEMDPYEQLWKIAREFRELNSRWLRTNVFELQAQEGLHAWQQMATTISVVANQLHLNSAAAAITADLIKKQMSDFRENAKIVAAILNPSVQERHRNDMSGLIALTIDPAEPITLLKLLENGAFENLNRIVGISEDATKEKHIEDALKAIASEWIGVQICFKTGKRSISSSSGENTIQPEERRPENMPRWLVKTNVNEIKLLIEDHQLRLQALQCLPHAVTFSDEISRWKMYLHDLSLILDLMVLNERVWKRIAPLFAACILGNEAEETVLFTQADAIHRSVSQRVETEPLCLELVDYGLSSETFHSQQSSDGAVDNNWSKAQAHQDLLLNLQTCQTLLERAGNNISIGFEARRSQFPRFYLLSDIELVAVLATRPTKESESVASSPQLWRYLRLCFPGVHHVKASVQRELTAFFSSYGEQVPISSSIPTVNVPVATWLTKLETSMATILQASTRAAINDFARKEFRKWCLVWPEQVILATIRHVWTLQGEISNKKSTLLEAEQAWRTESLALSDKIEAVGRELKAASSSSVRFTLSNVILLLHQLRAVSMQIVQDLVETLGIRNRHLREGNLQVSSLVGSRTPPDSSPFETTTWLAQPRFYYDAGIALGVKLLSLPLLPYGFEYCGNAAPPVYITPLTLRCFHALALHATELSRGSHVMGPAAIGKKTSLSALAYLSGRMVVHYDSMDSTHITASDRFHGLTRFLKGAVACGAWLMMSALEQLHHAQFVSLLGTICCQILDSHAAKLAQCTVLGEKVRLKKGIHMVVISSPRARPQSSPVVQPLQFVFYPVELPCHDLTILTEFFLLEHKMHHSKSLAKLINAVILAISTQVGLLYDGSTGQQQDVVNIRALRRIVSHLGRLCAHERLALCSAHNWPPTTKLSSVSSGSGSPQKLHLSDAEMPVDLVRNLEVMETKATCFVLREFAESCLPPPSLMQIDFLLQDFFPAYLAAVGGSSSGSVLAHISPSKDQSEDGCFSENESAHLPRKDRIEFDVPGAIHHAVKERVTAGGIDCFVAETVSHKIFRLYQALENHRVVVVTGDVQSGKTTAWQTLATAVNRICDENYGRSHMSELSNSGVHGTLRWTRPVVVHPRAVKLDQLFGSPSFNGIMSSDTLLTNLVRDAKVRLDEEDTWLVFDGDISETWADRLLQATDEVDADGGLKTGEYNSSTRSRLPGLLLPSHRKRTTMPRGMKLVIETTVLEDISPAFLAKVGVVHIGRPPGDVMPAQDGGKPQRSDWRSQYRMWKDQHVTTFAVLRDELFTLLNTLMDETMDACLDFVATEFGDVVRSVSVSYTTTLIRWRIYSFFALLHSLLLQSWPKISTMVSGKQRLITMHCYFLQALVWGIGHTSDIVERQKFHTFLRQWIISGPRSAESSLKRVLVLFFPSGTVGSTAMGMGGTQRRLELTGVGGASATGSKEILYNFGYSVELGSKWIKWPELYDTWLADRSHLGSDTSVGGSRRRHSATMPVPEDSSTDQTGTLSGSSLKYCSGDKLFVRTPSMAAAVFLTHQLMSSGYNTLLCGSRDAGKTTCGCVWLDLHAMMGQIQRSNAAAAGRMSDQGIISSMDDTPVENEHIYSGQCVRGSTVLEQLATFIERRRVQQSRHGMLNRESRAPPYQDERCSVVRITAATLVFVDDLHCVPANAASDNPLELIRGVVEHNQIVHPTANTLMSCGGKLVPFAALQQDNSRSLRRELHRIVARFVPMVLTSPSDVELSSIFSAFISSQMNNGLGDGNTETVPSSDTTGVPSIAQDTSQLIATTIKATVKLFRVLTSDQWTYSSTHHLASACQATKNYTAYTAFQPSKAYYLFHLEDVFRVLQRVCCDTTKAVSMEDKPLFTKLWCHEASRVFGDRLSDENDVGLFYNLLQDIVVTQFNFAPDGLLTTTVHNEALAVPIGSSNPKNHAQVTWLKDHLYFTFIGESSGAGMFDGYREVHEVQKVELSIERSMMGMYRANTTTETLPFVLCTHTIRHILRLTRVLRHNNEHLILIGHRGSKMHTLTRLAIYICRKNASSFLVPRGKQSNDIAWKAWLKMELLQCIRQPQGEQRVIIVKDMWLDNIEMYAPLDRYFSWSRLLSDIIAYDDFDDSILQTLRDEADRERREDTETRTTQDASSTIMQSKSSVVKFFFELVRRRLQFVLIFALQPEPLEKRPADSSATRRLAQLMWLYPHVQKTCTINYVMEWPEESLHAIAQKCFAASFGTDRDRLLQLSQVAVQLYRRTHVAWPVWGRGDKLEEEEKRRPHTAGEGSEIGDRAAKIPLYDQPCSFIQVEPSMLIEQISLFLSHLPQLQRELDASKQKYAAGLEFMERTEQILALEQSQQQLLQPEMAKKAAARRRMSGNLEKEKLAENKVHHALVMETTQAETQRTRLAQVEMEYDALIGEPRSVFAEQTEKMRPFAVAMSENIEESTRFLAASSDSVVGTMNSTDEDNGTLITEDEEVEAEDRQTRRKEAVANRQRRAMIRTFATISQPATSLRQLAECVGLIFGIEPVEARDELDPDEIFMDYWGTVTERMQTEEFWQELTHFDVRAWMTESVVARTLLTCTSPDFDTALFSTFHELAGLLCEWVQACALYARDSLLAEPKYIQLCQERLAYDTAIAQMQARQLEAQTQASTTSNANAMRNLSEQERKALEEKLKDNASTLQMATSVWKVLEPYKTKWRTQYEHYTQFGVQAMGDLLLATATMVYASSTTSAIRGRLRALWSEELDKHFVMHSPLDVPRPIHQVFLVDDRTLTKWHVNGLPCQEPACLETAVIAMNSYLFPVVIDPHCVATEWLKKALTDLAKGDVDTNDEDEAVVLVSGRTTEKKRIWQALLQCVQDKKPLVVDDFNETLAHDLLSLLQSKHRCRFDTVNQDLSSVAGRSSRSATSAVGLQPRRSSVGINFDLAEDVEAGLASRLRSKSGAHENQRCWFEVPATDQSESVMSKSVIECETDICLAYFIYREQESIPPWLASLSSYVSLVRFDFSHAQIRSKCIRTILSTEGGHGQVVTEVQTLQLDTIAVDEQIETVENEILEFFRAEDPVVVYGDTTKALKIVANRSALHTLESSKLEASKKIQLHYLRLASFTAWVERVVDVVTVWRDLSATDALSQSGDSITFPIEWIWRSLAYALTHPTAPSIDSQIGLFTTTLRRCVRTAFGANLFPLLFEFLLSLRVNTRRRRGDPSGLGEQAVVDCTHREDAPTRGVEQLVVRLIQLLECKDEAQVRTLCAGISSKLLSSRPSDAISVHKWRALCFLAEKSASLRALISTHQPGGKDAWRDAIALDQLLDEHAHEWNPAIDIDTLARLCLVAVLNRRLFVQEIETTITRELTWVQHRPSALLEPTGAVELEECTEENAAILGSDDLVESVDTQELCDVRLNVDPYTLCDLWKIYTSPSVAIVVVCRPETDFAREVSDIATQAKVTVDLTSQELITSEAFEKSLLQSIQKGRWVVVPHLDAHPEWVPIVSHVLTTIETREPHPDFRLWISVLDPCTQAILGSSVVTMRLVKSNPWCFDSALRYIESILYDHFPRLASRDSKSLSLTTRASIWNSLVIRACVLHALLSCRGLFAHASWKIRGFEYGDSAMFSLFHAMTIMGAQRLDDNADMFEVVRSLVVEIYSTGLYSASERLLLTSCVDLVFDNKTTSNTVAIDAANQTMPDVAQVIRLIHELEAVEPQVQLIECFNRIRNVIGLKDAGGHRPVVDLTGAVSGLRRVLESRGLLKAVASKIKTTNSTPSRGGGRAHTPQSNGATSQLVQNTTLVMDVLTRFVIDLEAYDLDEAVLTEMFPCEYKRPLNQLLRYEVSLLRTIRQSLVNAIRYLQQVASATEGSSPRASSDFASLMRGETPMPWLTFMLATESLSILPLDAFQTTILDRLRFFQSWLDSGVPSRFAIDKFQSSTAYVLEVIHQHLVRNSIDTITCSGTFDCIRTVRMFEDKPHLQLPIRENTMYISGWRLLGHLQTDITTTIGGSDQRKRSSEATARTVQLGSDKIREDGVEVILEISATCSVTTHPVSTDSITVSKGSDHSENDATLCLSSVAMVHDFKCPIHSVRPRDSHGVREPTSKDHCVSVRSSGVSQDCSIIIPTALSVPQLLFSSSHLRIDTMVEMSHDYVDRL